MDGLTLGQVAAIAGGAGTLAAAVVSSVVVGINGWRNRKQASQFREKEQAEAEARIAADREHALELVRAQSEAQLKQLIHAKGSEAAIELLAAINEVESKWTYERGRQRFDLDGASIRVAKQIAFRIPDREAAEIIYNGLEIVQNAWILAEFGEDAASIQASELKRARHAAQIYIAGANQEQEWISRQRELTLRIDEAWRELHPN